MCQVLTHIISVILTTTIKSNKCFSHFGDEKNDSEIFKLFSQGLQDSKPSLIPNPIVFCSTAQLPATLQGWLAWPAHSSSLTGLSVSCITSTPRENDNGLLIKGSRKEEKIFLRLHCVPGRTLAASFSSLIILLFSCSVVSNSLWPQGL